MASLTLFFQGFLAPLHSCLQLPGCGKGWAAGLGVRWGFCWTSLSPPGTKVGGAPQEGSQPPSQQPCLFFAPPEARDHGVENCLEAVKSEKQDGISCSGQVSGSPRRNLKPGSLPSFLPPHFHSCRQALGTRGFLTPSCPPWEGGHKNISLSSRNLRDRASCVGHWPRSVWAGAPGEAAASPGGLQGLGVGCSLCTGGSHFSSFLADPGAPSCPTPWCSDLAL